MTKEALKLALEAMILNNAEWKRLADSGDGGYWSAEDQDHYKQTEQAITAIKEALAQPEHGWTPEQLAGMARLKEAQDKKLSQRTWVGLTDEEILDNCESVPDYDIGNHDLIQFARAIEAKLKEKNELR